jgi:hypothetical protein
MRKFNALVFDEVIVGATTVFTSAALNDRLGMYDKLTLCAVADAISGTAPTLSCQIEQSSDQRNWLAKNGTAEIQSFTVNTTTMKVGGDTSSTGSIGFVRINMTTGGTNPVIHVKLYVVARDDSST